MQYVAKYSSWFEDDSSHAHMSQKEKAGKGRGRKFNWKIRRRGGGTRI